MRIVVALGGNALLKRGEPMTAEKATTLLTGEKKTPLAALARS